MSEADGVEAIETDQAEIADLFTDDVGVALSEEPTRFSIAECDDIHVGYVEEMLQDMKSDYDRQTLDLQADCFAAMYEHAPRINPQCDEPYRDNYMKRFVGSERWSEIHQFTREDRSMAEIASVQVKSQFAEWKKGLTTEQCDAIENGSADPEIWTQIEASVKQSTEKIAESAGGDVSSASNLMSSFCGEAGGGFGEQSGNPTKIDNGIAKAFRQVRDNENLRRIMSIAGRFTEIAGSIGMSKAKGIDDTVGVNLGNDISQAIPNELMLMCSPMEDDVYRRMVENQLIVQEYHSLTPTGQGPIMVLVDESGSMAGNRIHHAKGLALALSWVARSQNRDCLLVAWSSYRKQIRTVQGGANSKPEEIIEWASKFINSGTNPPIDQIPKLLDDHGLPQDRTDLIWITDGYCDLSDDRVTRFNEWRMRWHTKSMLLGLDCQINEDWQRIIDDGISVTNIDTETPQINNLFEVGTDRMRELYAGKV